MVCKAFKIVIVGVGGQGILFLGRLLAESALQSQYNVTMGEIHGMAQRGGTVECSIKISKHKIYSSRILEGQATVLIGLDALETARYIKYASKKTIVIYNKNIIPSLELILQPKKLDIQKIYELIHKTSKNVISVYIDKVTGKFQTDVFGNIYMLGILVGIDLLPFIHKIEEQVRQQTNQANWELYQLGIELGKKYHARNGI